ncbi:MAG: MFS transporter [Holophagales bacterium]|nr:MFS transporter [Holophagales bacterium]MYG32235.1 MFS transporter [Holophagales bacterium]MYI78596.1 MFS transporter [Holophagales bacterium]
MSRLIDHRLAALMVVAFVSTLGEFLVVALLPFYAERYGATPLEVGALVSAFALASMATAPLWGRLADRRGRRPALLLGLVVSAAGYLLFGLAQSLELLLLARLVHGVGGGTVPVVFAYIADSVTGERRAEGIGWVTAVTSSAAMIGPAVGGLAGQLHPAGAGAVAAAFSLAAAVFARFRLPESRQRREGEQTEETRYSILAAVGRVAVQPLRPLNLLIWIYAAGQIGMAGMTAIIGLYLGRRFGVDESNIGLFFFYLGGLSIAFRVFVLGPAVRRFGEVRILRAGAVSFGVGLIAIPFATGLWTLGAAIFLVPLGTSLLFPCTTSQVSKRAPRSGVVGQVLGVQQAYGNGSKIAAPLVAGYMFQVVSPEAPFVAIGAILIVAAVMSVRLR